MGNMAATGPPISLTELVGSTYESTEAHLKITFTNDTTLYASYAVNGGSCKYELVGNAIRVTRGAKTELASLDPAMNKLEREGERVLSNDGKMSSDYTTLTFGKITLKRQEQHE